MNREHVTWLGAVILLLITGLLIGRQFSPPADDADVMRRSDSSATPMRQWFWDNRSLDLLVQMGLIFAGALGIAALLPRGREEDV